MYRCCYYYLEFVDMFCYGCVASPMQLLLFSVVIVLLLHAIRRSILYCLLLCCVHGIQQGV